MLNLLIILGFYAIFVLMPEEKQFYDIVIMGSGLGGLLAAVLLGKKGLRVCVVEKNKQLGGNLQTFSRNRQLFDTGVHYIGGLDKGQNLYQIFKYAGIIDELRLERMDSCFDRIMIEGDPRVYAQAQGYTAFIEKLTADFPNQRDGLMAYCAAIQEVCASFPLYQLHRAGTAVPDYKGTDQSAVKVIEALISDPKLRQVLAANNLLYAGRAEATPFHVHALILNSYIESSWKCRNGGSQIAKLLATRIRQQKGTILRNTEITQLIEQGGLITAARTATGELIRGAKFLSNINPQATLEMTDSGLLRGLYRKRIAAMTPTVSCFSLHLVMAPGQLAYQSANYYYMREGQVWQQEDYTTTDWPRGYGLYFTEDRRHPGFTATVSVLTLMRYEELAPWAGTYNRVGQASDRGSGYAAFKAEKTQILLELIGRRFPELVAQVRHCYSSTPLTNRDYIGDAAGAMYGVQKDYRDPLTTRISPRTRIPNLFLTGQHINLHGILGTSLSAVLSSMMILQDESLVDSIRNA
ncbi:NAD(P)/FAD-dependent oxidoreductase [Niabella terrae]